MTPKTGSFRNRWIDADWVRSDPTLGERLFLPYTSKPIKLNTGLGLYQASEAMELMQGYLILSEHQSAGGTRFELSLTVRETI